jgi:hypothetical protein
MVTPIVSSKYRHLSQFWYTKIFSTNQNKTFLLLDYPGRVRSQITSVVCQIQRFDFDCILEVSRKVIIRTPSNTCTFTEYSGYSIYATRSHIF